MTNYRKILAACVALAVASPVAAQQAVNSLTPPPAPTPVLVGASAPASGGSELQRSLGPTTTSSVAGVRLNADAPPLAPGLAVQTVNRNPALMIVGATALVVGALIGGQPGTIIMVGGGVVGLVGLWRYLQ